MNKVQAPASYSLENHQGSIDRNRSVFCIPSFPLGCLWSDQKTKLKHLNAVCCEERKEWTINVHAAGRGMDACQSWVRDKMMAICRCMDKKGLILFLLRPALGLFCCYCESALGRRLSHCAVFFLVSAANRVHRAHIPLTLSDCFCGWLVNIPCTVFFLSKLGWPVVVSKHMVMDTWIHRQRHSYSILFSLQTVARRGFLP